MNEQILTEELAPVGADNVIASEEEEQTPVSQETENNTENNDEYTSISIVH